MVPENGEAPAEPVAPADKRLIARDDKKNPLFSAYEWSYDAVERLFKVPSGLMRERTQERAENLAAEREASKIDKALLEEGIEIGKRLMEEMLAEQGAAQPAAETQPGDGKTVSAESKCPFGQALSASDNGKRGAMYLNEVGLMSALDKRRSGDSEG